MCNDLPAKLLHRIYNIEKSVASAGYQMTKYRGGGKPRCQSGAVKTLRYKWKLQPISHPSFFWGCVCFNPSEAFRHDKRLWIRQIGDHLGCVFSYTDRLGRVLVKRTNHLKDKMKNLSGGATHKKFFQQSWTLAVLTDEVVPQAEMIKKLENYIEHLNEQVHDMTIQKKDALDKCEALTKKVAVISDKLRTATTDGFHSTCYCGCSLKAIHLPYLK